jgi:hypothetical protein
VCVCVCGGGGSEIRMDSLRMWAVYKGMNEYTILLLMRGLDGKLIMGVGVSAQRKYLAL